jgi:hypothetical protein
MKLSGSEPDFFLSKITLELPIARTDFDSPFEFEPSLIPSWITEYTVEFVYNEVQGTRYEFVIGIVRYKRNNVELPPLLKIVQ